MLALTCILLACGASAFALDSSLDVSQYAHTVWKMRDGFTKGPITAIAQTPDGYLWLGTESGLYRFDGFKNVLWHPPSGQNLPSNWIFSLLGTHDGTLWIGTASGLASWREGKLTQHPQLAGYYIFKIDEDHEGTVWASGVAAPTGRLCALTTNDVRCYGDDGGLGRGAFNLYEDSNGYLWAGVKDGLWRWKPGPPRFYPLAGEPDGIQALGQDVDGTLVVGWQGGIQRFVEGKTQPYSLQAPATDFRAVRMLRDRNGGLWIGTTERGLVHVHQGRADVFRPSDGLSGEFVSALFEDREGSIWIATPSGLDRFHEFAISTLSLNEGLSSDLVQSVLAARDGSVWLATNNGLNRISNGQIKTIVAGSDQHDRFNANSLFQDDTGRIWVSTAFAVGYLENDRFVPFISIPGAVTDFAQDTSGNLWIANEHAGLFQVFRDRVVQQIPWTRLGQVDHASTLLSDRVHGGVWLGFFLGGIAYFNDGRIQTSYTAEQGLAAGRVSDLLQDRDGTLWITTETGLSRLRNGQIVTVTSRNGLPCDAIHWIREDEAHTFWLYTACGLARIPRAELEGLVSAVNQNINASRTIAPAVFDSSDGVKTLASGNHFNPQIARSQDGRFWFQGDAGVSVFDPGHLSFNNLPPPVHIEQVIADRQSYNVTSDETGRVSLPPLIRDLQIDYTALSLVAPEKILFRYRLDGRDKDWQEAGNRRQAFYTDLPPGNYRFRVMACNNSGVWNETGTYFDFYITPAYYQTTTFRFAVVIAFLFALGVLYHLRLRQVARYMRGRMEERIAERERIARDLHDTFLQSVQGLILKFDAATKQIPSAEPARQAMEEALDRADNVMAEGRDRVRNLRDTTGSVSDLPAAFTRVVEENSLNGKVTFKTVVEGRLRELNPLVLEEAYAIGREALINSLQHSEGHHVEAEITYDRRQFRLRIRDDGRGIDPKILKEGGRPSHFGLKGMRERAERIDAQLKLWSGADTGTEVELLVPAGTAYRRANGEAKRSWFRFR